jgi:hypothetical protein
LTQVKFNKVGVPVDVTLLRNGQQVKFTLITRNIEDIKEPKIRHMYERMVRELGHPQDGTFVGTSTHDLTRTK